MAISPINPAIATSKGHKTAVEGSETTPLQQQKTRLNISILESAEASFSVKDNPLSLVLRSAIDNLNEILAPELGDNAIEEAYNAGVDVSPEATAQRIVDFATGLFGAFQSQDRYQNEDPATVLERFMEVIGNGIDQGFAEAKDILEGLDVLKGDIASNVDKTYELVQQGLQAFRERMSPSDESA